jgi:hypothetical protein
MAAGPSRLDFERWVQTTSEDELVAELERLDAELASQNPRSRAAYERHLVEGELARYNQARTIQERRKANLRDLRTGDVMPLDPGVWVHGRPLDERERSDLATFIRWVMAEKKGEQP